MKKILFAILGFSAFIISLSVAYYFVIWLPKKELNYKTEIQELRKDLLNNQNNQTIINTSDINNKLDDLESSMQQQGRDRQMQVDCESGGGSYAGSGTCVYR